MEVPVLAARVGAIDTEGIGLSLEEQQFLNSEDDTWDGITINDGEQLIFGLSGKFEWTGYFLITDAGSPGEITGTSIEGTESDWSVEADWEVIEEAWNSSTAISDLAQDGVDVEAEVNANYKWMRFKNESGSPIVIKLLHLYGDSNLEGGDDPDVEFDEDDFEEGDLPVALTDVYPPDLEFWSPGSNQPLAPIVDYGTYLGTSRDYSFRVKLAKHVNASQSVHIGSESLTGGDPNIADLLYFSLDGKEFRASVTFNLVAGAISPVIYMRRVIPLDYEPPLGRQEVTVRIVAYLNAFLDSTQNFEPPATSGSSTTNFRLGVNYQPLHKERKNDPALRQFILEKLYFSGCSYMRVDVAWSMIEPNTKGVYSASGLAAVEEKLQEIMDYCPNTNILIMLYWAPKWSTGALDAEGNAKKNGVPGAVDGDYAQAAEDFGDILGYLANRWDDYGVFAFEMWNEPDLDTFWATENAAQFANFIKGAYPVAKAAAPDMLFVLGGATYTNTDWLEDLYGVSGFQGNYDAIAFHPYMSPLDLSPDLADTGTPYRMRHVEALIDLMDDNGDADVDLWATEYGWSAFTNTSSTPGYGRGVTEAQQAEYLLKAQEVLADYPRVTAAFWYNVHDESTGNPTQDNFGLIRDDRTTRPALDAWVQTMNAVNAANSDDVPQPALDLTTGFAVKQYVVLEGINDGYVQPHLWWVSPMEVEPGDAVTLVGYGVGNTVEQYDAGIEFQDGMETSTGLYMTDWDFITASANAYTTARKISPAEGVYDSEHVVASAAVPTLAYNATLKFALSIGAQTVTPPADQEELTDWGSWRPDEFTAGVPDGAELTLHEGNFTTSANNQVVENLHITGRVTINHDGVKFYRCQIDIGSPGTSSRIGAASLGSHATSTEFWDCTVSASVLNAYQSTAIQGRDMKMYRCELTGTVDGVGAQYGNVEIYGCWIHDLPHYFPDIPGGHADGTHNDGVQIHGGNSHYRIIGNSIEMGTDNNAGIMINTDVGGGVVNDIVISKNWIISADNCASGINTGDTGITNLTITDNVFSNPDTWYITVAGAAGPVLLRHYLILDPNTEYSGNTYENGDPAPYANGG